MRAFIKAGGVISPQHTHHSDGFPEMIVDSVGNRLSCIEPDYRNLINPLLLRRMPRILKMGLASSQLCINRAGGISPDAIIVGTGLGCLDNLEKFLMDILDNQEHITTVLPFINSTHNAVAAQISMLLKNNNYNITYCHRGFSFESALQDALMILNEDKTKNVLVGGIDEVTNDFILLHSYLNRWKASVSNLLLIQDKNPGTIAGEGSSFFVLSGLPEGDTEHVMIEGVRTFLLSESPDVPKWETAMSDFLQEISVTTAQIDAVMLGINGDPEHDRMLLEMKDTLFGKQTAVYFKHLCGEYYTSGGFALWLASTILSHQRVPEVALLHKGGKLDLKNMLICNLTGKTELSFIYLRYGRL